MTPQELLQAKNKILNRVKKYDNFAILISDPDEDAVASGLALDEILDQMNKKVNLYSSYQLDDFSYLPRVNHYIIKNINQVDLGQFTTIFILDSSDPFRLIDETKYGKDFLLPKEICTINVDHHPTNSLFGTINYVPVEMVSSTGEALYDIFHKEITITPTLATTLLAAIIGDTGCFKYSTNTSPKTLRIAADLLEAGANHRHVIQNVFYSQSKDIVKANVSTLQSLTIEKVGSYTYSYTITDKEAFKNIVPNRNQRLLTQDVLRSIKGTDFCVFITPVKKYMTKLSFRSRLYKVKPIAEYFGGGGHAEAAAATVDLSVKEVLLKLNHFLETVRLPKVTE
jgi:phosphoesterase RecJ-like protein